MRTFLRLLRSFWKDPQGWLDLYERRIWVPEQEFEPDSKPKDRTMWG